MKYWLVVNMEKLMAASHVKQSGAEQKKSVWEFDIETHTTLKILVQIVRVKVGKICPILQLWRGLGNLKPNNFAQGKAPLHFIYLDTRFIAQSCAGAGGRLGRTWRWRRIPGDHGGIPGDIDGAAVNKYLQVIDVTKYPVRTGEWQLFYGRKSIYYTIILLLYSKHRILNILV